MRRGAEAICLLRALRLLLPLVWDQIQGFTPSCIHSLLNFLTQSLNSPGWASPDQPSLSQPPRLPGQQVCTSRPGKAPLSVARCWMPRGPDKLHGHRWNLPFHPGDN